MIVARSRGPLSQTYDLLDGEHLVATLSFALFNQGGTIEVPGRRCTVKRKGLSGPFVLRQGKHVLAEARKPGLVSRRFEIMVRGQRDTYELMPTSLFIRNITVLQSGTAVGWIRRPGWWRRRAELDLPKDTDPLLQAFLFWLVALLWRRAATAASG